MSSANVKYNMLLTVVWQTTHLLLKPLSVLSCSALQTLSCSSLQVHFFCFGCPVSSMPKSHGTCCKYFLLVRPSWIPLLEHCMHEVKKRRICWVTSTLSTESQQPIAAPKALKFCAQFQSYFSPSFVIIQYYALLALRSSYENTKQHVGQ